ncbi:3D-(3,5/4)-trihydroxycyclohexane-1,2-dione acylhydrolase (decyclizing) [Actinoallomurus iriomotensis]|uniref:3D-(3,5/4)-trihydroxycyclohexane-1,2-dione acylhydrolase (Decyclizing) n=1 Tax=Actinoallomurus iriomotensis TaxID=478107 RepID=A0A9W6VSF7_9ACTN|nr:3D-(3,5/4)-trihydroxycyclohexane-1,2-dione acylhydrolase (decyclizing) [Actinoallomurus iriomotensis]GLY83303.1 3D-(3,5/4)-trihydroxycyclohexane-1,2-dione acylhydrolase (decyclizing) [Actinoallomurus iriomotensis]
MNQDRSVRLTVAQALVRFLGAQYTERDGVRRRLFAGCFGIFGHGNIAGIGQALMEYPDALTYYQARNEQAMVHTAAAYARMTDRLSTFACTASVGPGSTNMLTAAAGATINRLPVLLLPGDVFATRPAEPVLQQLEAPWAGDVSVNDCFRPVSRYFDRIGRPEQLIGAALAAVRVLTDPVETGAVTLALPQDVQAEAYDWPEEFLATRVWRVGRPSPEPEVLAEAAELIRRSRRPLIVAGGGVIYSDATGALAELASVTGVPVAETQAGKGALRHDHPASAGAVGATGTTAANTLAREADLVIGIGTRYSDFTTASRTLFADPGVRFVNVNVARPDAAKHSGLAVVADARAALTGLTAALSGWRVAGEHADRVRTLVAHWNSVTDRAFAPGRTPLPAQSEVIGAVNDAAGETGVVVCAAGSMPGDLHKLWRTRDRKQYHVEYGYSCMGYEIAGGLGVKLAAPEREVFVLVGDGSYLMMAQELVTAVAEGVKLIVVLVQNHGFASIGALSETVGAPRFGTWYRYREAGGGLTGDRLPTDLAANAASLGGDVLTVDTVDGLRDALATAKKSPHTTVIQIETDPLVPAPDSGAWWDVPVAETSALDTTRAARASYETARRAQRHHL